jgi:hypothetical protein
VTETRVIVRNVGPAGTGGGGTVDAAAIAAITHAATAKTTPVDADEIGLADSAASYGWKKLTWAAIKATLKTYFDAVYQAAGVTWSTLAGKPTTFPNDDVTAATTDGATNPGKLLKTDANGRVKISALEATGSVTIGGPDQQGSFNETTLSQNQNYGLPDASNTLALTGNAQGEPDKLTQGTVSGYTENATAIGTVPTNAHEINIATSTYQSVQLTANTPCTFAMPTAAFGKSFILIVKQAAATGNGTAIFTGVDWGGAGTYAATATAGKEDALTFWSTATSGGYKWRGAYQKGFTT